jgi:hypothetical protein
VVGDVEVLVVAVVAAADAAESGLALTGATRYITNTMTTTGFVFRKVFCDHVGDVAVGLGERVGGQAVRRAAEHVQRRISIMHDMIAHIRFLRIRMEGNQVGGCVFLFVEGFSVASDFLDGFQTGQSLRANSRIKVIRLRVKINSCPSK